MAKGFLQNHKIVVLLQNIWATKRNNDTLSMEEGKTIRLSAAAKEFNVGVTTILEHLNKKGVKIDSNPNTKLPSDVYALLVKEYQKDKAVKQESEKKSLDISHRQSVSIDEKKVYVHEEEALAREDLFIKSNMDIEERPIVKKPVISEPVKAEPLPEVKISTPEKPVETVKIESVAPVQEKATVQPVAQAAPVIPIAQTQPAPPPIAPAAPVVETVKVQQPIPIVTPQVSEPVVVAQSKPIEPSSAPQPAKPAQIPVQETSPAPEPRQASTPTTTPAAATVAEQKVIRTEVKEEKDMPTKPQAEKPEPAKQQEPTHEKVVKHEKKDHSTENVPAKPHQEIKTGDASDNSDAAIKVLGKIDLDAMNFKTKPERKTKEEKTKFREGHNRPIKPVDFKPSAEQKNADEDTTKNIQVPEPQGPSNSDELADALKSGDGNVENLPNYHRAEVKKLEGPTILGTIKLPEPRKPEVKKPVASSSDDNANKAKKKKRKRIKKEGEGGQPGQGQPGQQQGGQNQQQRGPQQQRNPQQGGGGQNQQRGPQQAGGPNQQRGPQQAGGPNQQRGPQQGGGQNQQRGPQQGGNAQGGNTPGQQRAPQQGGAHAQHGQNRAGGPNKPGQNNTNSQNRPKQAPAGRFPNRNQRADQPKVELTEEEIQRQIKETLQRLSGTGKSKTSKHRREKRHLVHQQMQDDQMRQEEDKKILKVTEFVTANELASMMNVPVVQVISTFMSLGMFVSINQRLDAETLVLVADEFGYTVDFVSVDVQEAISSVIEDKEENEEERISRNPIVTVMGHVDHGKTSLLDYIRKSNVIAGEAGGITQHIGAYEVKLENGKKITFLDTPGHEAFTAMRARGAKITDVAIIVIACDDKIMPQTIEAINHAQAANVPLIFAINKIDKPNAQPEKIKEELAKMNLLVEDWGGKYQSQEISAKKGLNVDKLLEKVLLEAELLELKANPKRLATGTVIESSLDKGRGYVAKILVQDGTLKLGDIVLAGSTFGRVKAMYNERNVSIKEAGPSVPLLMLGLNGAPQAGDLFNIMHDEKEAKNIANRRLQLQREQGLRTQKHITLAEIGRRIAIGDFKELNIIVKGDVDGSVEALSDSLLKLGNQEVQVNVIHKSVGQISESDVMLASASNAIIIGFQVRPSVSARKLAENEEIDIRLYSIIYTAIDEIKSAIEGMLAPDIEEKIVCNIEVREVFKITKVGTIAGCMVLDGKITRNTKIRVIRDGIVVHTGSLGSLKRFKDDVKEVATGYECGLDINKFDDIRIGDIIEGYELTEVKRKL
jgi:translation initiation factor IF-2